MSWRLEPPTCVFDVSVSVTFGDGRRTAVPRVGRVTSTVASKRGAVQQHCARFMEPHLEACAVLSRCSAGRLEDKTDSRKLSWTLNLQGSKSGTPGEVHGTPYEPGMGENWEPGRSPPCGE